MNKPDCLALELNEAKRVLESAGISTVEIVITKPPRATESGLTGEQRVVRQKISPDGTVKLVAAFRECLGADSGK